MTSLNNLVRLHRWTLDEKRQMLAELEHLLDKLNHDLSQLSHQMDQERAAAEKSEEGMAAYPTFVAVVLERRRKLTDTIEKVEASIEAARDEVSDAYQELKKYEMAVSNHEKREKKKRDRLERLMEDEQANETHRRRAAGAS